MNEFAAWRTSKEHASSEWSAIVGFVPLSVSGYKIGVKLLVGKGEKQACLTMWENSPDML